LISLRSPLYVRGKFIKPDAGVKAVPLMLRGAGMVALGVIAAPAAGLLALVAPSGGEPNQCAAAGADEVGQGPGDRQAHPVIGRPSGPHREPAAEYCLPVIESLVGLIVGGI
jgi:hypothetical protein